MTKQLRVLLVGDSQNDTLLLINELKRGGYQPESELVDNPGAMSAALDGRKWDIIISDYLMPPFSGLEALKLVKERRLDLPFIIVSGNIGEDKVVEAMKAGAADYITKKDLTRLIPSIRRELKEADNRMKLKLAEEALRRAKESFSKAEKMAHLGYWEWDIKTNKLIWSDEVYRLYGLDPIKDIPTYDTVVNTLTAETREWFLRAIDDTINKNIPFEGEYSIVRPDGTVRYTHTIGEMIRDKEGNPLSMFGIVQDITERKKADETLQASEKKYSTLVERGNDGIVIIQDGLLKFVNSKIEELAGFTRQEVIGKSFIDFIAPEFRELALQSYKKRMSGEKIPIKYDIEILSKYGKNIPIEINASIIEYEGKPADMAIMRDITDRKQIEEASKESEEKFRGFFELSPIAIGIHDHDGKLIEANRKCLELFGIDDTEKIKGFNLYEYPNIPVDAKQRLLNRQPVEFESLFDFEHAKKVYKITGSGQCYFDIHIIPLWKKDVIPSTYLVHLLDITERRKAEEEIHKFNAELEQKVIERTGELKKKNDDIQDNQRALMSIVEDLNLVTSKLEIANKRLLELDRMKSMFIASTSHELRTPLNSIIGFSSILLEGWSGNLTEEQKEQIELIHSSGKHLLSLINDVIDISKLEAGKIESDYGMIKLRELLDETASTLRTNIAEKGLSLTIEAPDISIVTDRRRLLQCMINLLSNAVKYTEKGKITIIAKNINGGIDISVTDTGIGIKTGDIPKLFAPFVRLESPLTAGTSGTGLGLYLTQKLAKEVLGGEVKVESEYGKGSTFTLHIPSK